MSDDTFNLQEMFKLENLITRERDRFSLRYSTEEDLAHLVDSRVGNAVKVEITDWCFITIEDNRCGKVVFLNGIKNGGVVTMTSAVVGINAGSSFVFTRSGSTYLIKGGSAELPLSTSRVASIAGLFNQSGVGPALGMPDVFF
jgi:hypothetical protein